MHERRASFRCPRGCEKACQKRIGHKADAAWSCNCRAHTMGTPPHARACTFAVLSCASLDTLWLQCGCIDASAAQLLDLSSNASSLGYKACPQIQRGGVELVRARASCGSSPGLGLPIFEHVAPIRAEATRPECYDAQLLEVLCR